jgi:HEAT repeat protein
MAVRKKAEPAPEPMLQALPEETWRDLFGLAKRAERDAANKLVTALNKIDRGLLPPAATHPFEAHIAAGAAGIAPLLELLETGTEREWFNALDALAHITFTITSPDTVNAGGKVDDAVIARLRAQLKRKDLSTDQLALVTKTLAIARDHGVLHEQLHRLADADPGVVAGAARLLGLGRYAPAARVLRELVSPERFYESRAVIWALGELADPDVLPALYRALAQAFRVVDCAIAIGKIGQLSSVGQLTPLILTGPPEQRDAAVRALAMILDHHRNDEKPLGDLFASLKNLLEVQLESGGELSGSTRFHMLMCLARMGQRLDEPRVRRYLRLGVDDDAASVAKVFEKKKKR